MIAKSAFRSTALRACGPAIILVTACTGASGEPEETTAAWETRAPLPEVRTEVSVATDGSRIWLAGGFGPAEGQGASAPRGLWLYDPAADAWSPPGEIPEGVNHAGFVHHDGRLYLVGGFREATFDPVGHVRIYDPATNAWSQGAPIPTPRGALAVVVVGGRIHAIGGNAADAGSLDHEQHGVGDDDSSVGTHEVYDPATDTWSQLAPLPTPRNHLGAGVLDGRIHVVGGRVGGDFRFTTHEVYDPATDSWTSAAPLPTGRSGIAVVATDGFLYVFGGETFGEVSKTFDEAERFDPQTGSWESLPPMPTARHGLGAAAVDGRIHVLSGGPSPGFAFSGVHEVWVPGR